MFNASRRTYKHLRGRRRAYQQKFPPLAVFSLDFIGAHVLAHGFYEHSLLECLARDVFPNLSGQGLCLDIGANIGNHAVYFAEHFEQVIAFEPHPRTFKLLEANAMLRTNIEARNLALGSAPGRVAARFDNGNIGSASLVHAAGEGSVEFDVATLDSQLTPAQQRRVAFIKIDVEGWEAEVLAGAGATLEAARPVVAIEVLASEISDGTAPALESLRALGYSNFSHARDTDRDLSWRQPGRKIVAPFRRQFRSEPRLVHEALTFPLEKRSYPLVVAWP